MHRHEIAPKADGAGMRVGVVVSSFNAPITDGLLAGALARLEEAGVEHVTVVRVSGALEIPVIAGALAARHDAVVAIGAVIEGETDHYHHVATQSVAGLMEVSTGTGVPVGNALLTVRDVRHARERSVPGPGNKGAEAAEAALVAAQAIAQLAHQL